MKIKRIPIANNITIKIISLIFGYLIWLTFSKDQIVTYDISVPIYFFNEPENLKIEYTEFIKAKISGKKRDISKNILNNLASAHIDLSAYNNPGEYELDIYPEDIFLINRLNLLNYYPSKIKIRLM